MMKKKSKKSQRMKRCAKEWEGKQNFIKSTEMNAINSNWILSSVRKRIKYFVGLKQNYKRTIQFLDLIKSILHSMQTKCNNCMGNNTNMSFKIQFFFFIFQFSLEFVYSICNGFVLKLPKLEWSAKSSHCLWIELTSGSLVLGAHNTWISHVSMFIIVLLAVIFDSLFCSCIVFFIMLMIFQMDAVWIYNRNFLHYLFFSPQRWLDNFSTWCYYTMDIIVWRQSFHCFNHSIRFWIFFFQIHFSLAVSIWL